MPLDLIVLRRLRQKSLIFETCVGYRESSREVWETWENLMSKYKGKTCHDCGLVVEQELAYYAKFPGSIPSMKGKKE